MLVTLLTRILRLNSSQFSASDGVPHQVFSWILLPLLGPAKPQRTRRPLRRSSTSLLHSRNSARASCIIVMCPVLLLSLTFDLYTYTRLLGAQATNNTTIMHAVLEPLLCKGMQFRNNNNPLINQAFYLQFQAPSPHTPNYDLFTELSDGAETWYIGLSWMGKPILDTISTSELFGTTQPTPS